VWTFYCWRSKVQHRQENNHLCYHNRVLEFLAINRAEQQARTHGDPILLVVQAIEITATTMRGDVRTLFKIFGPNF